MSITVSNKEAIEVVAKFAKAKDVQPGEAAGQLIIYAGNRLAALRKYATKQGGSAPKISKKSAAAASRSPGKSTTVGGATLAKLAAPKAPAKAAKELAKISKILRSQEAAAAKRKSPSDKLPVLQFEDAKPAKTSFSKKFKK